MTSGINKRVAREMEGKGDRRRNESGGTTHLAILSLVPFRRANPYLSNANAPRCPQVSEFTEAPVNEGLFGVQNVIVTAWSDPRINNESYLGPS
jgi:hypothetical protein